MFIRCMFNHRCYLIAFTKETYCPPNGHDDWIECLEADHLCRDHSVVMLSSRDVVR